MCMINFKTKSTKFFLVLGILSLSVLGIFAFTPKVATPAENEITWVNWNDGFELAKKSGKIALIDCYTDWCGWCKVMDKKTFSDEMIINKVKKDFIAIKFNPEKKEEQYIVGSDTFSGQQLLYALSQGKPSGYPTFFFFVPQTNQMFQEPGYKDVAQFDEILERLLKLKNVAPKEQPKN